MTTTQHTSGIHTTSHGHGWHRMHGPVGHFAEMVAAMFAGMVILGGLRDLLGLTVPFADHPGWSFVLMATDMSIGMAVWMLMRGHGWAHTLAMCTAMYLPVVLLPLHRSGLLGDMSFMVIAHVVMIAAMLAISVQHHHDRQ